MRQALRGRLLAAVIGAVALALALTVLAFNLILGSRLDADANDLLRSRAAATLDSLQIVDGRLQAQEAPDAGTVDQPIWVFAGARLLEAPRVGAQLDRAARRLAVGAPRRVEAGPSTRLLSLPVSNARGRVGTVVAGVSLSPYRRSEQIALIESLVMALIVLLAVAVAARWLLRAGLRPVDRMAAEAAEWSERDLDRRFDLGPPRDEFTRLAATLDGLLDRVAAGVRREQRITAELSHEMRTPLAKIRARAQLALLESAGREETRSALTGAVAETDKLTRAMDVLVSATRAELGPENGYSADARAAAVAAISGLASAEAAIAIDVVGLPGLRVGVEADLTERILSPVIENACRHASSRVEVALAAEGRMVTFTVSDDGEGVEPDQRDRIFEPGVSRREPGGRSESGGAGLGLALSRRLARVSGGEVEARSFSSGGQFSIKLPQA